MSDRLRACGGCGRPLRPEDNGCPACGTLKPKDLKRLKLLAIYLLWLMVLVILAWQMVGGDV